MADSAPMADASLTNIQMVRPKGPKVFLGILAIAIVGAAVWTFTRPPSPTGEPDVPHKILIVGGDADVATTLSELGFTATHGTFEALEAEGSGEGIDAILSIADERGFGFVALHQPASHSLSGLQVTADSDDVTKQHPWAVFTVGDMGMPPRVTADPELSVLDMPAYVQVIQAAFRHQVLANTLFAESQLPMDAVELHAKLESAVELHGGYALLEQKIKRMARTRTETLVDNETVTPAAAQLAEPLERSQVVALGDGTTLAFVQPRRLSSPLDPNVKLHDGPEIELWYYPPGSTATADRQRCTSLSRGSLPLSESGFVASSNRDALMIENSDGLDVWQLDTAAAACAFTRKGSVPMPTDTEHGWGVPNGTGRVLRPASEPDTMAMRMWTAGGDDAALTIPLHGCTEIGDPVWLDAEHFAVSCAFTPPVPDPWADDPDFGDEPDDPDALGDEADPSAEAVPAPPPPPAAQSWIYVVRHTNQRAVALPTTVLGDYTGVHTMVAVPSGDQLDLVVLHPWERKAHRIRIAQTPAALFASVETQFAALAAEAEAAAQLEAAGDVAAEPAEPPAEAAGDEPADAGAATEDPAPPQLRPAFVPVGKPVVALAAESLQLTPLSLPERPAELDIAADGRHMVFAGTGGMNGFGHSITVVPLEGGPSRAIANVSNAEHGRPSFTADSKAVVFTSYYDAEHVGRHKRLSTPAPE